MSAYTEKARNHKDGSVVLSVADDRICKLNGVGALTWMLLEENPSGLSLGAIVNGLSEQFDAINAEGQLLYEVTREQLRDDTSHFLSKMTEMNLLRIKTDSRSQEFYYINEGVNSTTATKVAPAEVRVECGSSGSDIRLLRRETFTAFIGLLGFDLLLKFRGLAAVIRKVERWPVSDSPATEVQPYRRVRAMVDRAQMYYPKKAMCLQHSAVVTCLLRRRGVPAELVLAAQEFPPKAHAWSEVSGEVVNDNQRVKTKYLELRRV
jgi:hypothetical protein